jgi:hypothetical protein
MIRLIKRWEATCDTCTTLNGAISWGSRADLNAKLARMGWRSSKRVVQCSQCVREEKEVTQ